MTKELILQSSERIGIVSEELAAIQTVADAYALLANKQLYKTSFIGLCRKVQPESPTKLIARLSNMGD